MNALAIGSVTKAIALLLEKKLNKPPLAANPGVFHVTALPPDDDRVDNSDGVNLFLYRVTENPHLRNMPLPGSPAGSRPPLALNLHYLLTAYAKKSGTAALDDITAQQVLGAAMAILHEFPVLNRIHDSDFDAADSEQFPSELRQGFEDITVTMARVSIDDVSKIWTGFSKAYRTSIAYEVSLVQIPTREPPAPAAGLVQRTGLSVTTMGVPAIASIEPERGAPGVTVVVRGKNLRTASHDTTVTIDGVELGESDLVSCDAEEIRFIIPALPYLRPAAALTVTAGGRESNPRTFVIDPWISSPRPLRAFPGLPAVVDYVSAQPPASAQMEVDGVLTPGTIDAANRRIRFVVPAGLATNGARPVAARLTIGGVTHQSNAQTIEIVPHVDAITVTRTTSPLETRFVVSGQRLNGESVAVRIGALRIDAGRNTNPAQFTARIGRDIVVDASIVAVVDGRESNCIPPRLTRVEPARGRAGETITLTGDGLAGIAVRVRFGGHLLAAATNAYATRMEAVVPAIAPGTVALSLDVDGRTTGGVDFEVVP